MGGQAPPDSLFSRQEECRHARSGPSLHFVSRAPQEAPEPGAAAGALTDGKEDIAVRASRGCVGLGVSGREQEVGGSSSPGCATLLHRIVENGLKARLPRIDLLHGVTRVSLAGVLQSPVLASASDATRQWSC